MKRKTAKGRINTTHNVQSGDEFDAPTMYAALEARVAALEAETHQARIEDLGNFEDMAGRAADAVRRGPKSKFRPEDFLQWRDLLVDMLESNWPEIEPTCVPMVKATALTSALEVVAHKSGSQHQSCAEHLLQNSGMLLKFLGTSRFRGDPRQLANALAGAPKLTFWRSLKLGQAEPCRQRIGQRALKAYIRRKHPGLYRKLEKNIDLVHFINVWRAHRNQDDNIRDYYPSAIHHAWNVAKPQMP
jgi:hypothetical protein